MEGILEKLGIDWRLILAQLSTFLIFLWLLNRFVFGKFLTFLEERKQRIKRGLELTERMEQELARLSEMRTQTLEQIRKEGEKIILEAKKDAELRQTELLRQAREKAEKELERAKEDIKREKETAIKDVRDQISVLAVSLTEKVLSRAITEEDKKRFKQEALKAFYQEYVKQ